MTLKTPITAAAATNITENSLLWLGLVLRLESRLGLELQLRLKSGLRLGLGLANNSLDRAHPKYIRVRVMIKIRVRVNVRLRVRTSKQFEIQILPQTQQG